MMAMGYLLTLKFIFAKHKIQFDSQRKPKARQQWGMVLTIPAALSVTTPYPASCAVRVPAVPATRYCKRSFVSARLPALPLLAQDTSD